LINLRFKYEKVVSKWRHNNHRPGGLIAQCALLCSEFSSWSLSNKKCYLRQSFRMWKITYSSPTSLRKPRSVGGYGLLIITWGARSERKILKTEDENRFKLIVLFLLEFVSDWCQQSYWLSFIRFQTVIPM